MSPCAVAMDALDSLPYTKYLRTLVRLRPEIIPFLTYMEEAHPDSRHECSVHIIDSGKCGLLHEAPGQNISTETWFRAAIQKPSNGASTRLILTTMERFDVPPQWLLDALGMTFDLEPDFLWSQHRHSYHGGGVRSVHEQLVRHSKEDFLDLDMGFDDGREG